MSKSSVLDTRLTVDDYMRLPDDGKRYEIIDGELHVTPPPNLRHQAILGNLYLAIGNFLKANPHLGRAFVARLDVVLSRHDVVEPDLLVVAVDQLAILTPKNVQGPPAIIVEILSPSTRRVDEVKKRQLFERVGVKEYWLLDPDRDRIRLLRRDHEGRFLESELSMERGDVLETPILPGLMVSMRDLFEAT